jgi:hypothetical protein
MQMDDMTLVSTDDHMTEPLDKYENRFPAKSVLSGRCFGFDNSLPTQWKVCELIGPKELTAISIE